MSLGFTPGDNLVLRNNIDLTWGLIFFILWLQNEFIGSPASLIKMTLPLMGKTGCVKLHEKMSPEK